MTKVMPDSGDIFKYSFGRFSCKILLRPQQHRIVLIRVSDPVDFLSGFVSHPASQIICRMEVPWKSE